MQPTKRIDTVTKLILDSLTHFNLPLNRCRGQCYDGAANMCGRHTGVATQIEKGAQGHVYSLYGSFSQLTRHL